MEPEVEETPEGVYAALAGLRDHSEFVQDAHRLAKVADLAEWYEKRGFYTERQMEFALRLIREGGRCEN